MSVKSLATRTLLSTYLLLPLEKFLEYNDGERDMTVFHRISRSKVELHCKLQEFREWPCKTKIDHAVWVSFYNAYLLEADA